MPSTSRSVQENSINENLDNARSESKRRLSRDKDTDEAQQSKSKKPKINRDLQDPEESPRGKNKKPKRNKELQELSDDAKAAEVSELIDSAGEMGRSMDEFVRNSMEICKRGRHSSRQETNPTTSR